MNCMNCPACGGTTLNGDYVALDGSKWCEPCGADARQEVAENYASEELAIGDLHRLVLDVLTQRTERVSP